MTKKDKLLQLRDFYHRFMYDYSGLDNVCPFFGEAYLHGCDDLCHSFPKLTDPDEPGCPCHIWGPELAMKKLENLLIEENMIEG